MKKASIGRLISFTLVFVLLFGLYSGFAGNHANAATAKKKVILLVWDFRTEFMQTQINNIVKALKEKGFSDGTNMDLKKIDVGGNIDNASKVINETKAFNPDVIILIGSGHMSEKITKPLADAKLPLVIDADIENKSMNFIKTPEKPGGTVTGFRTFPSDLQSKAFGLLNKISPAKGKKAVFVTAPAIFNKADTSKALLVNKIELKDYLETDSFEKYKQFIMKYQKDTSVDWILIGVWPVNNIEKAPRTDILAFDIANLKKPHITFWESAVANCQMAGLAVDLAAVGSQQAEIAVQILNGKKPGDIPVQNPKKLNLVLNQQRVKDMKISFPADIMGGAYRIYTDYSGKNFVGQK